MSGFWGVVKEDFNLICNVYFLKNYFLFPRKGKNRKEISMSERNTDQLSSSHPPTRDLAHNPGTCPDQNRTSDLSVCGTMPNPLSHTSQDELFHKLQV